MIVRRLTMENEAMKEQLRTIEEKKKETTEEQKEEQTEIVKG